MRPFKVLVRKKINSYDIEQHSLIDLDSIIRIDEDIHGRAYFILNGIKDPFRTDESYKNIEKRLMDE